MNCFNQHHGENHSLYNGDALEVTKALPDNSAHFQIHSPPFSSLYIYSDSIRDMGNCKDDAEFFKHYSYLIHELYRTLKPGRLSAVHCKNLVNYKGRDGMAGLRDFRGEIIRHFIAHGFAYHSEVVIWKDPVIEMQRTKAHGLLHKQVCADSTFSRQGLPEYLLIFRKWANEADTIEPVTRGSDRARFSGYVGENEPQTAKTRWEFTDSREYATIEIPKSEMDIARERSIQIWQRYASPVWMDIRQTNVLNVQVARESQDDKHICPLQLDVIERAIELWTNPGDVVFDPFCGIGSSAYQALLMGRRGVGIELKESYWRQSVKFCEQAMQARGQASLFEAVA